MIKILHAADLHLNSPFGSLPPEKAVMLRDGQFDIIDRICELCVNQSVDVVLFAGDVFDDRNVCFDSALYFRNAIAKIPSRVFIAPGNHDYICENSHYTSLDWPENVHIFSSPVMERVDFNGLSVYGAGFNSKRSERGLLSGFHADNPMSVGVLHGDFNSSQSFYNPIAPSEIEASGLLYLALGHVHKRSEPARLGGTYYAYSGCAMGRGFDECGVKGGYMVEIADDRSVKIEFVPFGAKQYTEVQANADGCRDYGEICENIRRQLPPNSADCIIKLILHGTPAFNADSEQILRELDSSCFHILLRSGLCAAPVDIWADRGSDSLGGMYMDRLFELYSAAQSDDEREKITLAAEYAYAAIHGLSVGDSGGVEF